MARCHGIGSCHGTAGKYHKIVMVLLPRLTRPTTNGRTKGRMDGVVIAERIANKRPTLDGRERGRRSRMRRISSTGNDTLPSILRSYHLRSKDGLVERA